MGRPRKRRREGEAEIAISPMEMNGDTIDLNDSSTFPELGLTTPPQSYNTDFTVDNYDQERGTPIQHDLGSSDAFGAPSLSATQYVLSRNV